MFKNIYIECKIDIKGRNISNHSGRKTSIIELFDFGVTENTGMAITGHCSVSSYRAYAKPNNNHKKEALSGIINRLHVDGLPLEKKEEINISDSSSISSFSTISEIESDDSNSDNNNITQENFSSDHNNFYIAKEIMQKNTKHSLQEYNSILSDDNKKKKKNYRHKKITNITFKKLHSNKYMTYNLDKDYEVVAKGSSAITPETSEDDDQSSSKPTTPTTPIVQEHSNTPISSFIDIECSESFTLVIPEEQRHDQLENILIKQEKQLRALYKIHKLTNKKLVWIQSQMKKQIESKILN
ncbi:unnamed protein product [Rhizophagus irregularis]|nr:unnamed protein product [Rhizophagus irregularis]CAB4431664.1 unnamed protein product [Rhizophagus irregularis]